MNDMDAKSFLNDWRILTVFTVLSWGAYNIVLKLISGKIQWQLSMLMFVIGYGIIVGAYCLLNFTDVEGSAMLKPAAFLALGAGVLCGLGAVTFFKALPLAPGSVLMPLIGLSVLVAAAGCLVILKEPISLRIVSGIILAVISIMLLGK